MKRAIGARRGLEIIGDLADAALDIRGLTAKYGVDREDLARWALTEKTQRTLAGLCMLTDYQTQLMLSHYRVTAVTRLVEMVQATRPKVGDDGQPLPAEEQPAALPPDLVRKACVDLLRLNMGRIETPATRGDSEPAATSKDVLRKLLYGDLAKGKPEA
jgi:hypothetical protein